LSHVVYHPEVSGMTEKLSHKERTHRRILDEAASAMRRHGTDGIGVAALMKRAGLTHGGFYAHFASRDALVASAVDRMFADSRRLLESCFTERDAAESLRVLIDTYLSDGFRNALEDSCPLPGLVGEASRMPASARTRFNAGAEQFQKTLTVALEKLGRPNPAALARSVLAELIGAVAFARAATDDLTATEILHSSRTLLKERLGLA
jgi:TetR/AcrR family transcriptional repressor of nem operon